MTNEEAIRQNYVEEYAVAKELGWEVDERDICHNGPRFIKHWSVTLEHHPKPIEGAIHMWKVRDGWMCADMGMAKYFKNHRGYHTAVEGMRAEYEKAKIMDEIIDEIIREEQFAYHVVEFAGSGVGFDFGQFFQNDLELGGQPDHCSGCVHGGGWMPTRHKTLPAAEKELLLRKQILQERALRGD